MTGIASIARTQVPTPPHGSATLRPRAGCLPRHAPRRGQWHIMCVCGLIGGFVGRGVTFRHIRATILPSTPSNLVKLLRLPISALAASPPGRRISRPTLPTRVARPPGVTTRPELKELLPRRRRSATVLAVLRRTSLQ